MVPRDDNSPVALVRSPDVRGCSTSGPRWKAVSLALVTRVALRTNSSNCASKKWSESDRPVLPIDQHDCVFEALTSAPWLWHPVKHLSTSSDNPISDYVAADLAAADTCLAFATTTEGKEPNEDRSPLLQGECCRSQSAV